MEVDLDAVLGAEEARILQALRVFPGDVEAIHVMTGIPRGCIEAKVAALVALGYVARGEKWYEVTSKGAGARAGGGEMGWIVGKRVRVVCPRCNKVGAIVTQQDVLDDGMLVRADSMVRVHVFPGDVCEHEFDADVDPPQYLFFRFGRNRSEELADLENASLPAPGPARGRACGGRAARGRGLAPAGPPGLVSRPDRPPSA